MALLLLALLPLALPLGLVCFGGLAVMLFTWTFPYVGLPRMGGLLAALPEVRLPGMGCWCPFRVPQILCFVPLQGCGRISGLFRQNTYLQNKKHTLTCQGGTGCYRFNYQPGS